MVAPVNISCVVWEISQPNSVWCSPMVVTPKSNGKVRVCVDLSKLNEFVKRENHPLPAVDTMLGGLAGSTVFTKLDTTQVSGRSNWPGNQDPWRRP